MEFFYSKIRTKNFRCFAHDRYLLSLATLTVQSYDGWGGYPKKDLLCLIRLTNNISS